MREPSQEAQKNLEFFDRVVSKRKTRKVLGSPDAPFLAEPEFFQKVTLSIEVAGWAPFHYPSTASVRNDKVAAVEPWRFYVLENEGRTRLLKVLANKQESSEEKLWREQGKIPSLLAGAGAAVFITFLPEVVSGASEEKALKATEINNEHLAATAAATQTLLLAAEARGLWTYWSSGGLFKTASGKALLNIDPAEQLVAIAFLAPADSSSNVSEGKLRDRRSPPSSWCRVISEVEA
jgi:nitroreductase